MRTASTFFDTFKHTDNGNVSFFGCMSGTYQQEIEGGLYG